MGFFDFFPFSITLDYSCNSLFNGVFMKMNKLFLILSILSLGNGLPLHAAPFGLKSTTITALAAAAGAQMANGLKAIYDSIDNDRCIQLRSQLFDLERENRLLASTVNSTKEHMKALNPTTMLIVGAALGASIVGYFALIAYGLKNASASTSATTTDKEELTVKA